jgi:hypothetical protein
VPHPLRKLAGRHPGGVPQGTATVMVVRAVERDAGSGAVVAVGACAQLLDCKPDVASPLTPVCLSYGTFPSGLALDGKLVA